MILIISTYATLAMILAFVAIRTEKELVLLKELGNVSVPTAKTRITMAIDRPGKDASADFISVALWGTQAENVCNYLSKGRQIVVKSSDECGKL